MPREYHPEICYCNDDKFAGKRIKFRVPYTMPGELIVPSPGVNIPFPDATFLQNVELPFEIHSVMLTASQSVLGGANFIPIAEPAPGIDEFWRVRISDTSKNQDITKNAQLAATLKNTNRNVWDWKIPFTIIREEGFQVAIDNLLAANFLRAEISFIGYHLVLTPPSETR
ncbi:hypothetical protein LCGC14_2444570 [marine sediment metagenome]|uniref:Uncharacterized protein n=1 Tax=marine sediment metagenome TaxID=412755 RepID=A0A0F9EBV0_9ZZZZ